MTRFTEQPPLKEDAMEIENTQFVVRDGETAVLCEMHMHGGTGVRNHQDIYLGDSKKGASGGADAPEGELL